MSVGGSSSQSKNRSFSNSSALGLNRSSSESFIDPAQSPYLSAMRQEAQRSYDGFAGDFRKQAENLGAAGSDIFTQMRMLGNTQQVVDQRLEGLQSGLGDIFSNGLNSIGDNAGAVGAFGGSRQGVAEGVLGGEIAKAYTQGYGDITAQAQNQALQANQTAGSFIPQMQQTNLAGTFAPLGALQGLLGAPTVLNQSDSIGINQAQSMSNSRGGSESSRMSVGFK